jgi:hypothetical protein
MGGFLLFLILIVFFVVVLILSAGLSILRGILSLFFGKRNSNSQSGQEEDNRAKGNDNEKIFRQDEGEYVDFVEYTEEDPKQKY